MDVTWAFKAQSGRDSRRQLLRQTRSVGFAISNHLPTCLGHIARGALRPRGVAASGCRTEAGSSQPLGRLESALFSAVLANSVRNSGRVVLRQLAAGGIIHFADSPLGRADYAVTISFGRTEPGPLTAGTTDEE
jgi:hypothetical protein